MKRILWFRRDLRIRDNSLLSFEGEVLPIFIFDPNILGVLRDDDRRVSFIFDAVLQLKKELQTIGLDLRIFFAKPLDVFTKLVSEGYEEVVASGDYDAYAKERDLEVSRLLHFRYKYDTYLFKPDEILKPDGSVYMVFKPYFQKAMKLLSSKLELPKRAKQHLSKADFDSIDTLHEQREIAIASIGFIKVAHALELNPHARVQDFLTDVEHYEQKRDYFSIDATSRLSVHLRFGVLGVRELALEASKNPHATPFIRELIFRDYYAYLLFHMPHLAIQNFKPTFSGVMNEAYLQAFCEAKTGVPIVDAALQELLSSGRMHNRARMVCASFFTKHLLLPWQEGERFFAMHLLDYDAASNILGWQWAASTGVDAAPYFRLFNPYVQAQKFDKDAHYIKKHLPQLAGVDAKDIHSEEYLLNHEIKKYPKPIVLHTAARELALRSFKEF